MCVCVCVCVCVNLARIPPTAILNYINYINYLGTSLNTNLMSNENISMANQFIMYHSILELLLHSLISYLKQSCSLTVPWATFIASSC